MLWLMVCLMIAYGLVGALLYLFQQTMLDDPFEWSEFLETVVKWPVYVF